MKKRLNPLNTTHLSNSLPMVIENGKVILNSTRA